MCKTDNTIRVLSKEELVGVNGAGFFYELGQFFGQQANISDSIYRTYGNTNHNR